MNASDVFLQAGISVLNHFVLNIPAILNFVDGTPQTFPRVLRRVTFDHLINNRRCKFRTPW